MASMYAALLFGCSGFAFGPNPPTVVTVDRDSGNASRRISPAFAGFGFDVNKALKMIGSKGGNRVYAQLLRNMQMTPGDHDATILRIGGSGADASCFVNSSVGAPVGVATVAYPIPENCTFYNITDQDLDAYMTFADDTAGAKGANVTFALDINFGLSSDPAYVAAGQCDIDDASTFLGGFSFYFCHLEGH